MFRIVFMGTPAFAVPSLQALVEAGHRVEAVVTQPDRPAGRGMAATPPPVKTAALDLGLPVYQPETLKPPAASDFLRDLAPEFLVVAAYGEILTRQVLAVPSLAPLNVHASLLPRHRGASPIQHAILAGDNETGITIMRIAPRLDAGDIVLRSATPIGPEETADQLHDRLARLGARTLVEALQLFERNEASFTPQDEGAATYAAMLDRTFSPIDWARPAPEIDRQVRGLHTWPGAQTVFQGKTAKILSATPAPLPAGLETARPGELHLAGNRLFVRCGQDTSLELLRLQLPGRKSVSGGEFARGARLAPGEAFTNG